MAFAVRVRVVEPVAVQTQPLNADGALDKHWGNTTDGARLFGGKKKHKQDGTR